MTSKEVKTREQIDSRYKWNIEAMMPDESSVDNDLQSLKEEAAEFAGKFSGHLCDDADTLLDALRSRDSIWRRLEKIYVYAHMKRDENNADSRYQAMLSKSNAAMAAVSASMSFFTPELLSSDEKKLTAFIDGNDDLKVYEFFIKDALREKDHVLTEKEEAILSQMSELNGATNDIFTMLNNADMSFGTISSEDGEDVELTHGNYITFMRSHNRRVREEAYNAMYNAFKAVINTVATAYSYNTKTDAVTSRIRKYSSSRAVALSGGNIPEEVYDNLVSTVNRNLPLLHRYMNLRKKLMGLDCMYMYDIYVPVIEIPSKKVSFEEGLDMMRLALKPLGDEYINRMNKGISQGWIDIYENQGKTSGAYSFGCYDSYPYILLNYSDELQDVFTIIHEMGHSMHSSYTRENQPYIYGGHSIFTAEVASTVNESILMQYLLNKETDSEMRKYLINMHLEEFRTTLFRQTMFAEFEDITHKAVESGQVLTADWMCDEYQKLNDKYYGPAVDGDDKIRYEWARIPHFYNAFYVYQYATGYSAAAAISSKILKEGKTAADAYIDFLKTGESNHPIELLKIAGVDMASPAPVEEAMIIFKKLLDEFEELVS